MKANNEFGFVENSNVDEANVLALGRNISRHKWSIAAFTFVVALLAIMVASNITPTYRASSTLLIENKSNNILSIEQIYGVDSTSNEYLQTQFELLKSRALVERVVRELDLYTHDELDPRKEKAPLINWRSWVKTIKDTVTPGSEGDHEVATVRSDDDVFDDVVNNLRSKISINPTLKTQLVEVSVEMSDAESAVKITNALARAYIQSQLEAKTEMSQVATNWMIMQLEDLKSKLHGSERDLQNFLEQENLVNLNGITTISADELSNTSIRLTDARRVRNEAESMYRQVANFKGSDYLRVASVPAVMSDLVVAQFKAAEATANSKVEELSRRYGNLHPTMIAARTDLQSARVNLRTQVEQVVASIENSYQLAKDNEDALQNAYENNKDQIQLISKNEFRLRELQREVDANRSLYDTFMTRLKETSARQSLETVAARIIDFAVFPKHPIKPKKTIIVALSSILALIFGVGMSLLIEALNNTFKDVDEVESKLNLPVIGVLPYVKNKKNKLNNIYNSKKEEVFSEAIRSIRTSLIISEGKTPYKTIMITSTEPDEGKSSLANNLAIALGRMERVLLIDCDMRKPSIAKNYGLTVGTPGLVDVINGNEKLDNCIINKDGIDILTTGAVPPNPLELLSTARFIEVLANLNEKYDRIIIDGSPVHIVSDSLILSRYVNAVIYVIKSGTVNISHVQTGVGKLLQIGAPLKGVVLSQLGIKRFSKHRYTKDDIYGFSDNNHK